MTTGLWGPLIYHGKVHKYWGKTNPVETSGHGINPLTSRAYIYIHTYIHTYYIYSDTSDRFFFISDTGHGHFLKSTRDMGTPPPPSKSRALV